MKPQADLWGGVARFLACNWNGSFQNILKNLFIYFYISSGARRVCKVIIICVENLKRFNK